MKNLFITLVALLLVMPSFSQIEVLTNGKVNVGNPASSWQELNVGGIIAAQGVYSSQGSSFHTADATVFYDKDAYAFYLDPAGTSNLHYVRAKRYYGETSWSYFLEPTSTTVLNQLRANRFSDKNNPTYYMDADDWTFLNKLKVNKIWDKNDPGFYLDINQQSKLYQATVEYLNSRRITPGPGTTSSYVGTAKLPYDHIYANQFHYSFVSQFSDERTKENIEDMQNPLEKLMALTAKTFDYKETMPDFGNGSVALGSHLKNRQGFIAQEVKEIMPELVDFDESSGLHTMNYVELIPMLVKAIQEQQKQIDALTVKSTK